MMTRGTWLSDWTVYGASVRALGSLNVSLLQESIGLVIQRHESLRTRIVSVEGVPRQHIDRAAEYRLETVDLERVSPSNAETAAQHLSQDFADTNRDLSVGPLFEAKLLKFSSREHILLVALDHMFSDAISNGILIRDIWTLYKQAVQGRSPSLPALPLQFADYSVWQERTYDIWRTKHETYWLQRLSGAPSIQFPIDDDLGQSENRSVEIVDFLLDNALSVKLRDLARQEGTLLSLVILTVYVAAIAHWCNQRDIVLTFVSHGRYRSELENMIGLLPQRLFLRMELHKEDTFLDLLKRINRECQIAHQHQDYNRVPDLILGCPTDLCFNWAPNNWARTTPIKQVETEDLIEVQPFRVRRCRQNLDAWFTFTLAPHDKPTGLSLEIWYRDHLFRLSTIERFARYFRLLAEEFTKCPLTSIATVALA